MKKSTLILLKTLFFILFSPLVLSAQNKIIGFSESGPEGSDYSGGMVWSCAADGSEFKPLKKFNGQTPGRSPSIVFQGSDGLFYGVLKEGGTNGLGLVFQMNPDGSNFQLIWNRSITKLFQGSDGYLYGIRDGIYRLKNDGSQYWELANNQGGNTDIVEASDGKLYYGGSNHLEVHYINKDGSGAGSFNMPTEGANDGSIRRWRIFAHAPNRLYVYRDFFSFINPGDPNPPNPYHFNHYLMSLNGQIIKSIFSSDFFSYNHTAPVSEVLGFDHNLYKMNLMSNTNDFTTTIIPDFGCEGSTIGRTIRFADSSGNFYGERLQNLQWDIFSWKPADSSCVIIRQWEESMGYKGRPQFQQLASSGLFEMDHSISFQISPNPNPGIFSVEFHEPAKPGTTYRITDLAGRLIQQQKTEPGSAQQIVCASDLPNGLYFLQVVSEGKVLAVEKFVKQ